MDFLWFLILGIEYIYEIKNRCGSGISGEVLTEYGYNWIGVDISRSMLGNY